MWTGIAFVRALHRHPTGTPFKPAVNLLCCPTLCNRLRLLASAMTSWQLAVEETEQRLFTFQHRWQRQRLLQHSLLLWRSLVLLLKQQRQEAAAAEAWHRTRFARAALQAWSVVAAATAARKVVTAAAVHAYEQRLLRRKLLQWSLVSCASSAARVYYQHGLLHKVLRAWQQLAAASTAADLQLELHHQQQQQQQQLPDTPQVGVPNQPAWQEQALPADFVQATQQQQPMLPGYLLQDAHPAAQQQQQQPGGYLSHGGTHAVDVGSRVQGASSPRPAAERYTSPAALGGGTGDAVGHPAVAWDSMQCHSLSCPGTLQQYQQLQAAQAVAGLSARVPPWLMPDKQTAGMQTATQPAIMAVLPVFLTTGGQDRQQPSAAEPAQPRAGKQQQESHGQQSASHGKTNSRAEAAPHSAAWEKVSAAQHPSSSAARAATSGPLSAGQHSPAKLKRALVQRTPFR